MLIKNEKLLKGNFILTFYFMFKCQICCTYITNLLQFATNVRKTQRQPQRILQTVCEDRVLVESIFHFSLCRQPHGKGERAIHVLYPLFFCNLRSASNHTHTHTHTHHVSILTWSRTTLDIVRYVYHFCNIYIPRTTVCTYSLYIKAPEDGPMRSETCRAAT